MSSCSFNINLNKKIDSHLLYFLWNRWGWFFKSKFIGSHFRVWVIYVTEALSLIGKSRIWFYYCFGQCVLKVVTINNNKLGKGPWIILLANATTIRYQQWSKDSFFSYNEWEFFNGFSVLRATVKPLRILKTKIYKLPLRIT